MHKYKQYTRLFVFSIIAFIFLFPIIYLIVFSVFHSDTGFSLMNYYKVFLAKPDYLIKFWRDTTNVSGILFLYLPQLGYGTIILVLLSPTSGPRTPGLYLSD